MCLLSALDPTEFNLDVVSLCTGPTGKPQDQIIPSESIAEEVVKMESRGRSERHVTAGF